MDKAVSLTTTTESDGKIFMQEYDNKIVYKQMQGREIYVSTVCTFGERYD